MIYIFGTVGFVGGFVLGQFVLALMLRGRSREELLTDKGLRWKYGVLNWLIALLSAASAVWLYDRFLF